MIAILSGTNRPLSRTRLITNEVKSHYQSLSVAHRLLDLADLPAEIFSPSAYEKKPEAFASFSDAVLDADGLVVVTPEYNGSFPGMLKYFIDMLKFPESFEQRPVCFVGLAAGAWGALRPVEQLQQIFGYRNAYLFPVRVFIPFVHKALNEQGAVTNADISKRLRLQAEGFVAFVGRVKGVQLKLSPPKA